MAVHTAAHAAPSNPLRMKQIGLWLFILSESFLFSALISGRYYILGLDKPPELNQTLGFAITTVLLLSSLTAYRAEMFASFGRRTDLRWSLLATIVLGVLFVGGVAVEWSEAFLHFPPGSAFGTLFFSLTGLHAFHVLSGMAVLLVVYNQVRRGSYGQGDTWGVEGAVKYWHFVDVAWVFIYPTLYLVG